MVRQPIIVARPLHESWFKNLKSPFKVLNTRNHDHMCKNLKINVLKINHTYIKNRLSRSWFHNFKFQILKYFCEFIQVMPWGCKEDTMNKWCWFKQRLHILLIKNKILIQCSFWVKYFANCYKKCLYLSQYMTCFL